MPLLASLGEGLWDGATWTPYASMFIIELHQIHGKAENDSSENYPSGKAFRLLYNGVVLTPRMEGCPTDGELCDVSVLVDRVTPFSKQIQDCNSAQNEVDAKQRSSVGIGTLLLIIFLSAFLGCCGTLLLITKHEPISISSMKRIKQCESSAFFIPETDKEGAYGSNLPVYGVSKTNVFSNISLQVSSDKELC